MIAFVSIYLFVLAAAVPLIAVLLLRRMQKDAPSKQTWSFLLWGSAGFLLWQLLLSTFLFETESWAVWVRIIDPFFLWLLFVEMGLQEELSTIPPQQIKRFRAFTGSVVLLHAILQTVFLFSDADYKFLSWCAVTTIAIFISQRYNNFSGHPLVRYRLLFMLWLVSALLPLPFFRLFFLGAVIWISVRKIRRGFVEVEQEKYLLLREKQTVARLMEELSNSIRDVSNLRESLHLFLQGLLEAVEAKAAAVYLWDPEDGCYRAEVVEGYFFPLQKGSDLLFTRKQALQEKVYTQKITDENHLIWQCGQSRSPGFYPWARQHALIGGAGIGEGSIQSLILVPINLDNTNLGVLALQNKEYERYFSESDFSVVVNFSHHAAMMINSSRLLKEKSERQRVDHELSVGFRIQADLLPSRIPEYPGIQMAGSMQPAKEIGGDYYDFICKDENRLGIVIGDVSGKGVPAGMIMTMTHTLLHALYPLYERTDELLISVNREVSRNLKSSMFITLLFFQYFAAERKLFYTGCGHEHILIYRKDTDFLESIRAGGLALGMTDDVSGLLKEKELSIAPGDTVVLYTDGIVEARNPEGDMFGLDALRDFITAHHDLKPEDLRKEIIAQVDLFSQGAEQSDDITCLVMRFE